MGVFTPGSYVVCGDMNYGEIESMQIYNGHEMSNEDETGQCLDVKLLEDEGYYGVRVVLNGINENSTIIFAAYENSVMTDIKLQNACDDVLWAKLNESID